MWPLKKILEIRFIGDKIKLGEIRSRDLAEILVSTEDIIASVIHKNHPNFKKEDVKSD